MFKKISIVLLCTAVIAGLVPTLSVAACLYNSEADAVWIYDYPENVPARPGNLLFFDQINNWGLIAYDATNDTYTVNANLWIGRNDGSDTFFQLGSPDRPHETLIMNGNLVIYPTRIKGENAPEYISGISQLTIGMPDHPEACARLLFQNEPKQHRTLRSGAYYKGKISGAVSSSGRFHVYNGIVSAVNADLPVRHHLYMYLSEVVLINATISRVTGTLAYGAGNSPYRMFKVKNTVFELGGNAVSWGNQAMSGVTFRKLNVALGTANIPIKAELTECRFVDNQANWALRPCGGYIYLIDCEINPPLQCNRYPILTDKMPEAKVVSSRHIRVKVTDHAGKPVPGVRVETLRQGDGAVSAAAMTGKDGCTPGNGEKDALLLDEWMETPGNEENRPIRREYSYSIRVIASDDVKAEFRDVVPDQSWKFITLEGI